MIDSDFLLFIRTHYSLDLFIHAVAYLRAKQIRYVYSEYDLFWGMVDEIQHSLNISR